MPSFTEELYRDLVSFNRNSSGNESNIHLYGELIARIGSGCIGVFLVVVFNVLHLLVLNSTNSLFTTNLRLCLRVLGVVDLLGGTICYGKMVLIAIDRSIYSDTTTCIIASGVMLLFVGMSHMILMLITIDRYIAVTRPLRYHTILTRGRIKLLIMAALISGALMGELPFIHWAFVGLCHSNQNDFFFNSQQAPAVAIYIVIPFVIVMLTTVLNVHILFISKSHEDRDDKRKCSTELRSRAQLQPHHEEEVEGYKARPTFDSFRPRCCYMKVNKGTITVSVVVGASYLVWTPGFLLLMNTFGGIPKLMSFILYLIMYSNHWLNPVVFFIMKKSYRVAIIRLLKARK